MFDALSDRLQAALGDVRSRGQLTEEDVNKAMRQVRLALLEADVNFKVVKQFTSAVKERALGQDVLASLNPGQQVVKIVSEELTALMGGSGRDLALARPGPTVILMAGLQGSGKTTACGKLARHLREEHGMDVAVAACDVYRPAAVDQLVKVGAQAGATVYEQGTGAQPGRHRGVGARPGQARPPRRAHHRHERPAPHRPGAHEGARRRQEAHEAAQRAARDRRDDRPGRGQRRRAVRRDGRLRRRRPHEARRRRPRRRGAVGQGGHRQADPVRVDRARSSATSSASTRIAWRSGSSAWAT